MSVGQDQAGHTRGDLAAAISTAFVGLLKEHADRGPTKCRTYIDDELIIVLMRGGYSRLENTLFEDGKWLDVRSTRHAFSDTMEGRFTETIEPPDRPDSVRVHERKPPAARYPGRNVRARR